MKALLALFLAAFAATPALAQTNANFTGPRVEVTAGLDDVTKYADRDINYGAAVGADIGLGDRLTVGAEANVANFDAYRDYGVSGRLGLAVTPNLLLYGTGGYANFRGRDGLRAGAGAEFSTGTPFYGKVEYRYSDLDRDVRRHAGLVGFGLRF